MGGGGSSDNSFSQQTTGNKSTTTTNTYDPNQFGDWNALQSHQSTLLDSMMRPTDLAWGQGTQAYNQFNQGRDTLAAQGAGLATEGQNLQNLYNTRIAQPTNLDYSNPFSNTPDALTQQLISQGRQGINLQNTAAQNNLAQKLAISGTGNNSALLSALNRQSQYSNAGAGNQLYSQAMQTQRGFDALKAQIQQQQNAMRLGERGQLVGEIGQGQNMLTGRANMLGGQQSLLDMIRSGAIGADQGALANKQNQISAYGQGNVLLDALTRAMMGNATQKSDTTVTQNTTGTGHQESSTNIIG